MEQVRLRHGNEEIWDDFAAVTREMEQALAANDPDRIREAVRENHRLLQVIGVVPDKVASFIRAIEALGGAAKICGAGATAGDRAGVVWVSTDADPSAICRDFGYPVLPVRGEPLGVRLV